MGGMFGALSGVAVVLYFVVVAVLVVLVVWALVLTIIFLRLRIAEARGAAGTLPQTE